MLWPRSTVLGLIVGISLATAASLALAQNAPQTTPITPPRPAPRTSAPPSATSGAPAAPRQSAAQMQAPGAPRAAAQPPSAAIRQGAPVKQPPSAAAQAPTGQAPPAQQPALPALSPAEQAELDHVLAAWEQKSTEIKTLATGFTMWEYDAVFGAPAAQGQPPKEKRKCEGMINFAAPDKGSYEVTKGSEERWMCDGKAIYEFDYKQKKLKEYRLPKELQGKAITNGPLPFVFGAQAEAMKKRYVMRIFTPPDVQGQIWLEAWPRWQQDAANFHHVHVILDAQTMLPKGIRLFDPVPPNYKVYGFDEKPKVNGTWDQIKGFFARPTTPLGWQHVVEEPPPEALPGNQPPAQATVGPTADARAKAGPPRTPAVKK